MENYLMCNQSRTFEEQSNHYRTLFNRGLISETECIGRLKDLITQAQKHIKEANLELGKCEFIDVKGIENYSSDIVNLGFFIQDTIRKLDKEDYRTNKQIEREWEEFLNEL